MISLNNYDVLIVLIIIEILTGYHRIFINICDLLHRNLICAFADLPADHRSALGDDMQKYIAGEVTREELAATIDAYWQAQN